MGHVMGNSTKVKRKKVSTYAHRCVVYFCLEHGAPNVQLQFSYQESEEKKKKKKKPKKPAARSTVWLMCYRPVALQTSYGN